MNRPARKPVSPTASTRCRVRAAYSRFTSPTCSRIGSIRQDYEYQALSDARVLVNRLVQHLLGACRVYLDHGAHHAAKIQSLIPSFATEFGLLTHVEYDGSSSYRICEALRNHSQHQGFVVGDVSVGASRTERAGAESVLLYRVGANVDIQGLSDNPKTKPIVRDDLKGRGKNVDVRPLLREYIGCLSSIHEAVRAKLNLHSLSAEAAIEGAFERFGEAFPEESAVVLAAVERYSDGSWIRRTILSRNLIERRRLLCRRNPSLVDLGQGHVSSEPRQ